METTAALFLLTVKCERYCDGKINAEVLDDYLMRSMFGATHDGAKRKVFSIQNSIDAIGKYFPSFQGTYNTLSETAHPSWPGTQGAYSNLDEENHTLNLGWEHCRLTDDECWRSLFISLRVFLWAYNDRLEILERLQKAINP